MSNQNTNKLQWVIVILISMLLITACNPASQLLGKWNSQNQSQTIEFLQNDLVTFTVMGVAVNGTYKVVDDTHLQVNLSGLLGGLAGTQIFTYKLTGDSLVLTLSGNSTTYTRVK